MEFSSLSWVEFKDAKFCVIVNGDVICFPIGITFEIFDDGDLKVRFEGSDTVVAFFLRNQWSFLIAGSKHPDMSAFINKGGKS